MGLPELGQQTTLWDVHIETIELDGRIVERVWRGPIDFAALDKQAFEKLVDMKSTRQIELKLEEQQRRKRKSGGVIKRMTETKEPTTWD